MIPLASPALLLKTTVSELVGTPELQLPGVPHCPEEVLVQVVVWACAEGQPRASARPATTLGSGSRPFIGASSGDAPSPTSGIPNADGRSSGPTRRRATAAGRRAPGPGKRGARTRRG